METSKDIKRNAIIGAIIAKTREKTMLEEKIEGLKEELLQHSNDREPVETNRGKVSFRHHKKYDYTSNTQWIDAKRAVDDTKATLKDTENLLVADGSAKLIEDKYIIIVKTKD